jgi:hypothetical protein
VSAFNDVWLVRNAAVGDESDFKEQLIEFFGLLCCTRLTKKREEIREGK